MGFVEKGGEVRATVIDDVDGPTFKAEVRANVAAGSILVTDESAAYNGLKAEYARKTVNHSAGVYVTADGFSTNGVESLWALFKRQYHGTHHWVSGKHMNAYLGEMTYRLNRSDMRKGDRVNNLLSQTEGPLPYKVLIA